nr:polysaccharide biosynthesis/export family protein [Paramesorhizobium deserti]
MATAISPAPNSVGSASLRDGLSGFSSSNANKGLQKGDVIEVTILDTGEEGLLSPTETKTLNLGRFSIDQDGFVTLPFVGRQHVAGSSPEALQKQIVKDLRGSAVNPQAVVTVVEKPSSTISVDGDVRSAGRFPLKSGQERMLDALALAGGSTSAPGSTMVTLVRGSQRGIVSLARIITDNRQNVGLSPGDQIFVEGDTASFTALGAFKSTGEFKFDEGKLTLAKALGRIGGLLDDRADARNIYLFRSQTGTAGVRPIIYHINLREVANFTYMQAFQMQDDDILYASNAPIVNAAKLLTVLQKSPPMPAAPAPAK